MPKDCRLDAHNGVIFKVSLKDVVTVKYTLVLLQTMQESKVREGGREGAEKERETE